MIRPVSCPRRREGWMAAAVVAAALAAGQARAATLVGSQVHYVSRLGAGVLADLGTQTVADGTTFVDNAQGLRVFFVGNQLLVENTVALAFAGGAFNGPQLVFGGGGITGATVDAASSIDFNGAVTTTANTVQANYAGLAPALGSTQVIDLAANLPLAGQPMTYNYLFPTTASQDGSLGTLPLVPTTAFLDGADGILVAIAANKITVINLLPLAFAGGVFNGPSLTFSGINLAGASIDPISAGDFQGVLSSDAHGLSIDFAGLNPAAGHALVIDVQALAPLVSGVPEPVGWALMIMGFGAAGAMLRQRRATGAV